MGRGGVINTAENLHRLIEYCPTTGCWLWMGTLNKGGYGSVSVKMKRRLAHRVMYEHYRGPIPKPLVLDHLCRTPVCVNPDHLEAVTDRVNLLRGNTLTARRAAQTHCMRGHAFTPENTYRKPNGTRRCRACFLAAMRRRWARKRDAVRRDHDWEED